MSSPRPRRPRWRSIRRASSCRCPCQAPATMPISRVPASERWSLRSRGSSAISSRGSGTRAPPHVRIRTRPRSRIASRATSAPLRARSAYPYASMTMPASRESLRAIGSRSAGWKRAVTFYEATRELSGITLARALPTRQEGLVVVALSRSSEDQGLTRGAVLVSLGDRAASSAFESLHGAASTGHNAVFTVGSTTVRVKLR